MLRLYGGLAPYWQQLQQPLIERGLHYHYASAHSPLAAKGLAQAGNDRLLTTHQQAASLLKQLPIHRAGLDNKLTLQLQRLGLNTLGQAQALPRSALGQRLELLYEIERSTALRFPLKRLLDDLEAFLAPRQLRVLGLNLSLEYREHTPEKVHIGCSDGEYRAVSWLSLAMLRLEQLQLKAPLIAIGLKTKGQMPWAPLATQLFEPSGGKLTAGQLISRLQNKLGDHALQQVYLRDDHRPERSFYQGLPQSHYPIQQATQSLRPSLWFTLPQPLNHKPNHQ